MRWNSHWWLSFIFHISLLLPHADKSKNNEIFHWCFHFHLRITVTYNMHHCQAKSPNPKSQVLSLLDICKKNSVCLHVFSILGSGGLNELGRKSMKKTQFFATFVYCSNLKGNKNLRISVLEDHEFLQSKDFLEKPRPYTFHMGSRLSLKSKIRIFMC